MKKTILYFSSFGHSRWGGQKSLFYLVTGLDKRKFKPVVCIPIDDGLGKDLRDKNVEVIVTSLPKVLSFRIWAVFMAIKKILSIMKQSKAHLVHTDGPRNTFYAGLAARLLNIPLVWHVRVSDRDIYDPILYVLSSKIVLVAQSIRKRFNWAKKSEKFVTIYNGIDFMRFNSQDKTNPECDYQNDKEVFLMVSVGRIEPLKGQHYIIEACGMLKDVIKKFNLLIIGDVTDRAYMEKCKKIAQDYGIQDRVKYIPYQNDVEKILSAASVFISTSLSEAFPRSIIEAMAAGIPVIVTDVGGCTEAVENEISGYVIPPANAKALAEKITQLYQNKDLRRKIIEKARGRVESMFTMEKNLRQTESLYDELISTKSTTHM